MDLTPWTTVMYQMTHLTSPVLTFSFIFEENERNSANTSNTRHFDILRCLKSRDDIEVPRR